MIVNAFTIQRYFAKNELVLQEENCVNDKHITTFGKMMKNCCQKILLRHFRLMFICLGCYLIFTTASLSQTSFEYTSEINEAYELILSLQFEKAQSAIDKIKSDDPKNYLVHHIENYIDFFKVFIGEQEADFYQFKINKEKRLKLIQDGNPDSPYYLFSQAEIQLQWALARTKFGEVVRAGWDINKAYKQLKQNEESHPDFLYNKKSLSLIHSLIGSVSGIRKGLIQLFTALEGSHEQGIAEVNELYSTVTEGDPFYLEIVGVRALMARHVENDLSRAYEVLFESQKIESRIWLMTFLKASLAQHMGKNEEVIQLLNSYSSADGYPFYYLNLILGKAYLAKMDSAAKANLTLFINRFQGKNYIKEAYQKMAWYELLVENQPQGYRANMSWCQVNGNTTVGADQAAHEEAKIDQIPNRGLLAAQVAFDGGYYDQAKEYLKQLEFSSLLAHEQLEFRYRMARIFHKTKMIEEAITYYTTVVNTGSNSSSYFACNSALQLGHLYYEIDERGRAADFLQLCTQMNPKEHRESIHQKAKLLEEKIKRD